MDVKYLAILYYQMFDKPPTHYDIMKNEIGEIYNLYMEKLGEPYDGYFEEIGRWDVDEIIDILKYKKYIWCMHDLSYNIQKTKFMRDVKEKFDDYRIVKYINIGITRIKIPDINEITNIHPSWYSNVILTFTPLKIYQILTEPMIGLPNIKMVSELINYVEISNIGSLNQIFKSLIVSSYYLPIYKNNMNLVKYMYIHYVDDYLIDADILKFLMRDPFFKVKSLDSNGYIQPINDIIDISLYDIKWNINTEKVFDLIYAKNPHINYTFILLNYISVLKDYRWQYIPYFLSKGMDPNIKINDETILDYLLNDLTGHYANHTKLIIYDDKILFVYVLSLVKSGAKVSLKNIKIIYKYNIQQVQSILELLYKNMGKKEFYIFMYESMKDLELKYKIILKKIIYKATHFSPTRDSIKEIDIYRQLYGNLPGENIHEKLIKYAENIDWQAVEFS